MADLLAFLTVWTIFGIVFGVIFLAAMVSLACSARTIARAIENEADVFCEIDERERAKESGTTRQPDASRLPSLSPAPGRALFAFMPLAPSRRPAQ